MELTAVEKTPLIRNDSLYYKDKSWQRALFLVFAVISFVFIVSRLFVLQVVKGSYYKAVSDENRIRVEVVKAYRGVIKDRNGHILAQNAPSFNVKLRKDSSNFSSALNKLADFINTENFLDAGEFLVFDNVNRDIAIKIESNFSGKDVLVEASSQREYLYPNEFAHLLGYINTDKVGMFGIERTYDTFLRGSHGSILYEYSANGEVLREIAKREPVNGGDLTLTIDSDLQITAYSALKKAIDRTGAIGGAIIAQNPKNGEILALVSIPSFDPNLFSKGISSAEYDKIVSNPASPLFNRVLMGQYPPGSVFKIVTASAVLAEKIVDKNTRVLAPQAINIGSFVYRDWKAGGHGEINITRALAESADTFFYKVAGGYSDFPRSLGPEKLALWARKFGLGAKTGVDFGFEEMGLIPDPAWKKEIKNEQWYIGDSYITAIGQGDVLTTPIQVNQMASVIANGGYLLTPRIVEFGGGSVRGLTLRQLAEGSDPLSPLVSSAVIETVKQGLKEACELGGTGYPFFDFSEKNNGIKVACKTGTSEFGLKNARYEYQTHAWFTVFAPADNAEIALTVFLEGGGGGARDAAPVAREILDVWSLSDLDSL